MNSKTICLLVVFAALASLVTSAMTSTAFATHNNGNGKDPHLVNPSCDNPNAFLKNKNCDIDDNEDNEEEEDNGDDNEDNPGDGDGGEV